MECGHPEESLFKHVINNYCLHDLYLQTGQQNPCFHTEEELKEGKWDKTKLPEGSVMYMCAVMR